MNLYYWPEFGWGCDLTPGMAFAIAETEQQAKKIVIERYYSETGISDDDEFVMRLFQSEVEVLPLEEKTGRYCFGGG